jgi:hypothetical protein
MRCCTTSTCVELASLDARALASTQPVQKRRLSSTRALGAWGHRPTPSYTRSPRSAPAGNAHVRAPTRDGLPLTAARAQDRIEGGGAEQPALACRRLTMQHGPDNKIERRHSVWRPPCSIQTAAAGERVNRGSPQKLRLDSGGADRLTLAQNCCANSARSWEMSGRPVASSVADTLLRPANADRSTGAPPISSSPKRRS